jgi:hypothetical protein
MNPDYGFAAESWPFSGDAGEVRGACYRYYAIVALLEAAFAIIPNVIEIYHYAGKS